MSATTISCIVGLIPRQSLDRLIHVLDDELVILHHGCSLLRDGVIVSTLVVLPPSEGHSLLVGTIPVGGVEVDKPPQEVGLPEHSILDGCKLLLLLLAEQLGDDPVASLYALLHIVPYIPEGGLVTGVLEGGKGVVAAILTPDNITCCSLLPEELSSIAVLLMIECIDAIESLYRLVVIGKVLV